jgi:hypothetical protein
MALVAATLLIPEAAHGAATLVGLWHLDGDAQDASGNGHHGTIVGATPTTAGVWGTAFSFDGNDRIMIPGLDFSGGSYSVNLWLQTTRPAQTEDWRMAINKIDGSGQTFQILLGDGRPPPTEGANAPMMQVWKGGTSLVNESVGFNSNINARDGQWHMVTMTYAKGDQKLYIDGCVMAVSAFSGVLPLNNADVAIGGQEGLIFHHPWIGALDEVSIYTGTLTQAQVRDAYRLYRPNGGCGGVREGYQLVDATCKNLSNGASTTAWISRNRWSCAGLDAQPGDTLATETRGTAE